MLRGNDDSAKTIFCIFFVELIRLKVGLYYKGYFISPSRISDLCDTVAGMVTSQGSISIGRESLNFFVY
jgi:hypothetical protein